MSRLRVALIHLSAFVVPMLVLAAPGVHDYLTREHPAQLPAATPQMLARATRPDIDPRRPVVVVLLGADVTEITDALGPYEVFARAGGFDVVTAAPERRPTLLTGGLAILPHYALDELDARLGGRAPDVVVVPNIPNVDEPQNEPIVAWLRRQATAGSLIHSWCKGAMALAHAGLLDGKTATAHWGDLSALERRYPRVHWVRGVRWVEHEGFVMSAGLTSGIDASLRVIMRLSGEDVARRVAHELRYPSFRHAIDPATPQYAVRPADAVLLANAAFGSIGREALGLALYDDVGELDLSHVYDAHAHTMAAEVVALGEHEIVRSAHGLTLLPAIALRAHEDAATRARALDRIVVPGPEARERATAFRSSLESIVAPPAVEYLHADAPERFGLAPVLEDLARSADSPTATFALRRMEYRGGDVNLAGSSVPWRLIGLPLALGTLALLIAHVAMRLLAARARALAANGCCPVHAATRRMRAALTASRPASSSR